MTIFFILNPHSGNRYASKLLIPIKEWAKTRNLVYELVLLDQQAEKTINLALQNAGLVIVGGGDGTLTSTLITSLKHNPTCPIALLPLGTGNDLCREHHLTVANTVLKLNDYLDALLTGPTVSLATWRWRQGQASGQFVNYLSIGLDSVVVQLFATEKLRERFPYRHLGKFGNRIAYGIEALAARHFRLPGLHLIGDTAEYTTPAAAGLILSNIKSYMGLGKSCTLSDPTDQFLEATLFPNSYSYLRTVFPFLPVTAPKFMAQHTTWAIAGLPEGHPLQCDGELTHTTTNETLIISNSGNARLRLPASP